MVGFCKVMVISENKTHKEIGYYEFLYGSMLLVFSNILMEVLNNEFFFAKYHQFSMYFLPILDSIESFFFFFLGINTTMMLLVC